MAYSVFFHAFVDITKHYKNYCRYHNRTLLIVVELFSTYKSPVGVKKYQWEVEKISLHRNNICFTTRHKNLFVLQLKRCFYLINLFLRFKRDKQ